MTGYKLKTQVDIHDVDYNGIAKTSSIMKFMQTAAQSQLTENGMSYNQLKARSRAFVISRFNLEIMRALPAYTPITAISYPIESRGYSFLRCYELETDGIPVARAVSAWALLDTETKALVRVNDFDLGLPILPSLSLTLPHIKLPSEISDIGSYGVHYGDVDQNMHMNNTKYPDMYSNFIPLPGRMIRRLAVNYISEAALGEKLKVQRASRANIFYFRTLRQDGRINSEAEIEICDI